jgi:hypothetical protein
MDVQAKQSVVALAPYPVPVLGDGFGFVSGPREISS